MARLTRTLDRRRIPVRLSDRDALYISRACYFTAVALEARGGGEDAGWPWRMLEARLSLARARAARRRGRESFVAE